jgi:hypothetical protein
VLPLATAGGTVSRGERRRWQIETDRLRTGAEEDGHDVVAVPSSEVGKRHEHFFPSELTEKFFPSRHASAAGGENHDAIRKRIITRPERRRPRRKHRASPGEQSIRDGPRSLQSAFAAVSAASMSFTSAVNLPPAMESVEREQPVPNLAFVVPSSKLLIWPDSEPAGAGPSRVAASCSFSLVMTARYPARCLDTGLAGVPPASFCEVGS